MPNYHETHVVTNDMLYELICSVQEDIKQLLQKQSETSALVSIIQKKLDTLTKAQGRTEERVVSLETDKAISAHERGSILEGVKILLMAIGALSTMAGVLFAIYRYVLGL